MYLALRRIERNKRTKSPYLDLSNCDLHYRIPDELFECTWLKGISFGFSISRKDPDWAEPGYSASGNKNKLSGHELKALNLVNLEEFYCSDVGLETVEFLCDSSSLKIVNIDKNNLESLWPLAEIESIEYLSAKKNNIAELDFLEDFINLKELDMSDNIISDIYPLTDVVKLEKLTLSRNRIEHLGFLDKLINLKEVYLDGNLITSFYSLLYSEQLEKLYLADNRVSDQLDMLQIFSALKELNLKNNRIPQLDDEVLVFLRRLKYLGISGNPIANYSEDQLKALENLSIEGKSSKDESVRIGNFLISIAIFAFGGIIGGAISHGNIAGIIIGGICGPTMVLFILAMFDNPHPRYRK
jgi:Leucine-rich repeat (LRR) protein